MKANRNIFKWLFGLIILAIVAGIMWLISLGIIDPNSAFQPDINKENQPFSHDEIISQAATVNRVNILFIGADISEERLSTSRSDYRSDVLMVVSIDFNKKSADIISVPRDSYAPIYETPGKWKINAAFAHGGGFESRGPEYAMKTVSNLLCGIPVNYYVGIDMNSLENIIDALGGVDYDVDVKIKLNGRTLEKGMQRLNGQQVLDYCRARKNISTDTGRNDRQQRMLLAVFNELKAKDQLLSIAKVYDSMKDRVYTNLTLKQIITLIMFCRNIETENINRYTLNGEYRDIYGANFYLLDIQKKNELIKNIFGVDGIFDEQYDVNYILSRKK